MQYFKDKNNEVWAFEDDVEDIYAYSCVPKSLTPITKEEAEKLSNPPKTQQEINAEALATFKSAVQTAIDKTDSVAVRCLKAGVEFPTEWREYTVTLRTLLASTVVVTLPVMPDYPSGS